MAPRSSSPCTVASSRCRPTRCRSCRTWPSGHRCRRAARRTCSGGCAGRAARQPRRRRSAGRAQARRSADGSRRGGRPRRRLHTTSQCLGYGSPRRCWYPNPSLARSMVYAARWGSRSTACRLTSRSCRRSTCARRWSTGVLALHRRVAAGIAPIGVTLGPATTFHPVNPVVYLDVTGGDVASIRALRSAVSVGALDRKVDHEFVPHATIVESTTPERIEAALVALAGLPRRRDVRIGARVAGARTTVASDRGGSIRTTLIVGRGGIETEITVSSIADPAVIEFMGERHADAEWVLVARRDQAVVAAACARDGALLAFVGDPDLERQLLKMVPPISRG